jgi:glycerophosphoryl diester phosphodiesterase
MITVLEGRTVMNPTAPWPYPRLIAHRGGGRLAPENTMAGMRAGAQHGYRMFEYDVKLSKDNVLILLHDDDVDRTTNGQGPAGAKTYAELAALDAGAWHSPAFAGARIPTLEEVARYTIEQGIASNVEIKPCPGREMETGTAVALAVRELWRDAPVAPLLSSFSEAALTAAHVAAPKIPRALLVDKIPPDWRDRLVQHDCVGFNVNQKDVTPELVKTVHDAGYRLAAWTVNDPARARQLLDWGVDAIFTDELAAVPPDA